MPTLRFGKVWQVIRHFGVLFFAYKTVISKFVTTRQILLPHIFLHMVTPTMFPWDKKLEEKKASITKKVGVNYVLIPF
jgi:hypothetical protein